MNYHDFSDSSANDFNAVVNHPLQSYEWGEFRKKTGIKVIRKVKRENNKIVSVFQITLHKIPKTPFFAGYFPKGNMPDASVIEELKHIGQKENCIFIQLEPNVKKKSNFTLSEVEGLNSSRDAGSSRGEARSFASQDSARQFSTLGLRPAVHPLFTRFTFQLDLNPTEEELLKNMHSKTRYNIKVAQKNGVTVQEDNSDNAFETYIQLTNETTQRQKFYAHSENYHRLMWKTLKAESSKNVDTNRLTAHLLTANYQDKTLVTWILFIFKDTLYYPYGASSREHREVMASNLMMWEAIKFGKKLGLKKFDMWGALGQNPDPNDPWYGFHRFKQGYGPEHIEFVGSYDLITNPLLYPLYSIADKVRWFLLNLKK